MGETAGPRDQRKDPESHIQGKTMNRLIYIIGLVVVVLAVLAFFGMR
jgi:hypothetical protein